MCKTARNMQTYVKYEKHNRCNKFLLRFYFFTYVDKTMNYLNYEYNICSLIVSFVLHSKITYAELESQEIFPEKFSVSELLQLR